ncbi:hypothetical protein Droror1_Dr00026133 [Drosera rotundifolia]
MSWLRTAVHKAVVAGNRNNLSRIRSVADTVVQHAGQAMVGGARLIHDRIGNRNVQSFGQAVKRLEELSVSCKGEERVLLLRRWLVSLKEVEKFNKGLSVDAKEKNVDEDLKVDEVRQPSLVLYHDLDQGGEPLNFHDAFLHSEALEGITLSMILEGPNDEEVALLLEIFGLCLMGGKEVHNEIVHSIQELAKVFTGYKDEVLMKREELLQFAQKSITGLKISADLARIDVEVSGFKSKLDLLETKLPLCEANGSTSEQKTLATAEALKEALAQVRIYSKLKALLLEKKAIQTGDSPESHAEKVDKLKILLESLTSSSTKAENRILEHRSRKEEALSFRLAKANEVSQVEKDLVSEIGVLERKKEELEAELRKVNSSLAAVNARLRNAKEERQQFDVASNEIVQHLQTKEDELSKSVASCRAEADVVGAWISFIQDTWDLQSTCAKQKADEVNDELGRYAEYFANLAPRLLLTYKSELGKFMIRFTELVEKLKSSKEPDKVIELVANPDGSLTPARKRKNLEEEYLDLEAKLITTFSVVESIEQLYSQNEDFYRKDDQRVDVFLDSLQEIKDEFDSMDRPTLRVETPTKAVWGGAFLKSPKGTPTKFKPSKEEYSPVPVVDGQEFLDSDEELAALESEYVKIIQDHAAQEINDWEL